MEQEKIKAENEFIDALLNSSERERIKEDDLKLTQKIIETAGDTSVTNIFLFGTSIYLNLDEIMAHGLDAKTIKKLTKKYDIIWPWSLLYDAKRQGNNKRWNKFPLLIVFPKNAEEVSFWIKFCSKYNFTPSIRSGGHNYEYFSGQNEAIIDTSKLLLASNKKQMKINDDDTVTVTAGTRLGLLYNKLAEKDLIIAGGICPSVCIGGLITGGGIGYMIRKFGLAMDNLVEAKIVLASGQIIVTSNKKKNKYRDLFKAIKGAGAGNFGVITKYKVKTHKIKKVVYFVYTFNLTDGVGIITQFQTLIQTAPDDLAGMVINIPTGTNTVIINGIYSGALDDFNNLIQTEFLIPLSDINIHLVETSIQVLSFVEAEQNIALEETASLPAYKNYKIRSNIYFTPIDQAGLESIVNFLQIPPAFSDPTSGFSAIQIAAFGGFVSRVPPSSSVFGARNNGPILAWIQSAIYWNDLQDSQLAFDYINSFYNLVLPLTTAFADPNVTDLSLSNYLESYYGVNVPFLSEVKTKYDPNNLFQTLQPIPL